MNVAFIHSGFSNSGGIERVVSIILNEMSKREDYRVISIEFLNDNRQCVEVDNRVRRVPLYQVPLSMTKAVTTGHIIQKTKKYLKKTMRILW